MPRDSDLSIFPIAQIKIDSMESMELKKINSGELAVLSKRFSKLDENNDE